MLARAFYDDPITEFMLPGERTRLARNARVFRLILRQQLRRGHPVHVAAAESSKGESSKGESSKGESSKGESEGVAAALWVPPDEWKVPSSEALRAGLPFLMAVRRRVVAATRGFAMLEAAHPRVPPHWYLAVLGTDPEHQGRGHGSRAMAPMLARCDDEGVAAFLESSKESNVPFYERHGFRVIKEITFGADGPPLWQMLRAPRP